MNLTISMPERLIRKLKKIRKETGIPISTYIAKLLDRTFEGEQK